MRRLAGAGDEVARLADRARALGDRLGPDPVSAACDTAQGPGPPGGFLATLPAGLRAALVRAESWFADDVYAVLKRHAAALCIADSQEELATPFVATAGWGYLRLRREDYDKAALRQWAERLRASYDARVRVLQARGRGAGPALADSFRA